MSIDNNKLYEILGVSENAPTDEIKLAYKRLASKFHPDRGGDPDNMFPDINKAYKILADPVKRQEYDKSSQTRTAAKEAITAAINGFINESIKSEQDINNPVLFSSLVGHFKNELVKEVQALEELRYKKQRLINMKGKVKLVNCDYLYTDCLKHIKSDINHNIIKTLKNIKLLENVNNMLEGYEADERDERLIKFTRPSIARQW